MIDPLCTPFQTSLKGISRFPCVVQQSRDSTPLSSFKSRREFFSQPGNSFKMLAKRLPVRFIS